MDFLIIRLVIYRMGAVKRKKARSAGHDLKFCAPRSCAEIVFDLQFSITYLISRNRFVNYRFFEHKALKMRKQSRFVIGDPIRILVFVF